MQNYSFGWKWIKHFTENENAVIIAFLKSQQQPLSASDAANNLQPKLQGRSVHQMSFAQRKKYLINIIVIKNIIKG